MRELALGDAATEVSSTSIEVQSTAKSVIEPSESPTPSQSSDPEPQGTKPNTVAIGVGVAAGGGTIAIIMVAFFLLSPAES